MSTSFKDIVSVLQVRCTGYYEIDRVWIDYIYLENHTAVVSDIHTHGIVVEYPKEMKLQRSERYKVKVTAKHNAHQKYPFQFLITFMTPIPPSDDTLCCGPSYAVILNQPSPNIPQTRPYTHSSSILMMQGMASPYYIALKYMLKHLLTSSTSHDSLWKDVFEYSFEYGHTFRLIELESISAWNFIHDHDWPCNRIPKVIHDEMDQRNIQRLREIATAELDRRYTAGERDRDPKVDLPSGKCDVVEASRGGFTFEGPFEACVRELQEETGLLLSQLVFEGFSVSESQELHVRSRFYFFSLRPEENIKIGKQDCYVASSWTLPAHIKSYMRAVEGSEMKRGRFDSLRRVGDAEVIFSALSVIQQLPEEQDQTLWTAITGAPAPKSTSRGHGRSPQTEVTRPPPKTLPPPTTPLTTNVPTEINKASAISTSEVRTESQPEASFLHQKEDTHQVAPMQENVDAAGQESKLVAKKKSADIIIDDGDEEDTFDESFLQSFSKLSTNDRGDTRGRGRGRGRGRW